MGTTLAPAVPHGRSLLGGQDTDTTTCTVPAPPKGTSYAAAPCAQGGQVNTNTKCAVNCALGNSQGKGTYSATCQCTTTGTPPVTTCKWDASYSASCQMCAPNTFRAIGSPLEDHPPIPWAPGPLRLTFCANSSVFPWVASRSRTPAKLQYELRVEKYCSTDMSTRS